MLVQQILKSSLYFILMQLRSSQTEATDSRVVCSETGRTLIIGGQLMAADGAAVMLLQPRLEARRMKRVRRAAGHHLHTLPRRQLFPVRPESHTNVKRGT